MALFTVPALQLLGAAITRLFGGEVHFQLSVSLGEEIVFLALTFFNGFLCSGGINEESGWRGFALPRLQARYPVIVSMAIVWFFWALWHIPYDIGQGVDPKWMLSSEMEVIDTNKDEALVGLLAEIDIQKKKVVIWCAFLFSVKKIQRILTKLGIPVLTITGETKDANKVVQQFQKSKDRNVLICTQKKAAESVTLTSARFAIYYSNIWSNDARLNSEARIRRKGSEKHKSIMYIDLLTKASVEKQVYDCLRKKKDLINEENSIFRDAMGGRMIKVMVMSKLLVEHIRDFDDNTVGFIGVFLTLPLFYAVTLYAFDDIFGVRS